MMTENHKAAEHHSAAAKHHIQAARYHREASRHYEAGKDWSHAAHQALAAHGHGLLASREADKAHAHYSDHHLSAWPIPSDPEPRIAARLEVAGAPPTVLSVAEHHEEAAAHHEQAAHHHHEAFALCEGRDYAHAAHAAQMAHRHAHYSVFHDNQAAMHQVEHYGKSGQSAELA